MKILAVDDELYIRKMLNIALNAKNYSVLLASNADEAIDMAFKEKPDVILLDIMMPGKNGFYVLKELRANEITAHIPVIMLTSIGRSQDVSLALEMGANNYVIKPFEYEDLLSIIKDVTEPKKD